MKSHLFLGYLLLPYHYLVAQVNPLDSCLLNYVFDTTDTKPGISGLCTRAILMTLINLNSENETFEWINWAKILTLRGWLLAFDLGLLGRFGPILRLVPRLSPHLYEVINTFFLSSPLLPPLWFYPLIKWWMNPTSLILQAINSLLLPHHCNKWPSSIYYAPWSSDSIFQ